MRHVVIAPALLLAPLAPLAQAQTQFSFGMSSPGFSIGFSMPAYPDLMLVPGTPVYYDREK